MKIGIDLETFSPENLKTSGLYRYALNPQFDILLLGYSIDEGPVVELDCTTNEGRRAALALAPLLQSPECIKTAFNAAFEWYCLSVWLNRHGVLKGLLPINQWRDTQLAVQYCGYPSKLETAGQAIGLPDDKQKLSTGKTLIRLFCTPRTPTKKDRRTRVLPGDEPEKWELFKQYNIGDVVAEQEIARRLSQWPVPDEVQRQWELDTLHNAMGVNVDMALVDGAIRIGDENTATLLKEAADLTGLENPNSRDQLLRWLTEELPDDDIQDVRKDTVSDLLKGMSESKIRRVLEIRQETGKASHKKYAAIRKMVCADGRLRGLMKFYGANRTGRWASVGVQLQNLARTHIPEVDTARGIVEAGNYRALQLCYGNVSSTLGQLVRTALVPSPGNVFVDADFSAIEARVIAWLAGEEWVLDVFRTHGKIYEATASNMFGVPMELIKKGNPEYELRQRGKVATLACIAEGSLVPVKFRDGSEWYLPIELVTAEHRVWDGCSWVHCDGAICNGYKEVITYDGLTATEDHLVWIEGENEPVPFGVAAQSRSHLVQSGPSGLPVWVGKNHKPRAALHARMEQLLCTGEVRELREGVVDPVGESHAGEIERVPKMLAAKKDPQMAGETNLRRKAKVREPKRSRLQRVRSPWYSVSIFLCSGLRAVSDVLVPGFRPKSGDRQNRHQRPLRTWKFAHGNPQRKSGKPQDNGSVRMGSAILAVFRNLHKTETGLRHDPGTDNRRSPTGGAGKAQELARNTKTVKVYDILNAGPHHRYTVQGRLVHNCGYQGGAHAMAAMDISHSIDPSLYPELVKQWRKANPAIVKYWYDTEQAALDAMRTGRPHKCGYCTYAVEIDEPTNQWFLTCELPSGRKLFYVRPTICENRFGKQAIRYWGIGGKNKKWCEIDTYGGRLVENQCQAVARDCLAEKLWPLERAGYPVVFSIHDEIVADAPADRASLDEVIKILAAPVSWASGLPLNADGWVGAYFRKE